MNKNEIIKKIETQIKNYILSIEAWDAEIKNLMIEETESYWHALRESGKSCIDYEVLDIEVKLDAMRLKRQYCLEQRKIEMAKLDAVRTIYYIIKED